MSDKDVRTVQYVGMAGVGAWFGVPGRTVAKWIARYADSLPTPEPDVMVGDRSPGWLPGRESEWRDWEASRPTHLGKGGPRPKSR